MMIAITGQGECVRKYAAIFAGMHSHIIAFPERELDANEQAAFYKNLDDKDITVITLSPWIISDADSVQLVTLASNGDYQLTNARRDFGDLRGASVNKIMMTLWRKYTVSDTVLEQINSVKSVDELVGLRLGDSAEKILKFNQLKSPFWSVERLNNVFV